MKNILIIIVLLITCNTITKSQNLVPNGSFEEQHNTSYCNWLTYIHIENYVDSWFQPTRGTPDIFNDTISQNCYASTNSQVIESIGKQNPRTGHSYIGITTFTYYGGFGCNEKYKEYVGVKLPIPIFPNLQYDCYFYTSLSDNSYKSTNNIGLLITDSIINNSNKNCQIILPPTINSKNVINDTKNWVQIRDTITLTKQANYLYIGNFFANSETIVIDENDPSKTIYGANYYIDDVVIVPIFDSIIYDTICLGNSYTIENRDNKIYSLYSHENLDSITTTITDYVYYPTDNTTLMQFYDNKAIKYELYVLKSDVSLPIDTSLCEGESVNLSVNYPNSSYLWQDNSTDSSINVTNPGLYWVQLTNMCGVSRDSITVLFKPIPIINIGADTSICVGTTLNLDATYPNATYVWKNIYSANYSTKSNITINNSGMYWVEVTNNNCSFIDSIQISFNPLVILNLGKDTAIVEGNSITLNAGNNFTQYTWSTNETTPSIVVSDEGNYSVTVIDSNGCSKTDDINIVVNLFDFPNVSGGIACENSTTIYKINTTYPPNTHFTWNVIGGEIVGLSNGEDIYEIEVKWNNPKLDNSVTVDVLPPQNNRSISQSYTVQVIRFADFTIEGKTDVCKGDTAVYSIIENENNLSLQLFNLASEIDDSNNSYWNGLDSLIIARNSNFELTAHWKNEGKDKILVTEEKDGCLFTKNLDVTIHSVFNPTYIYNSTDLLFFENEHVYRQSDSIYTNSIVNFTNQTFEIVDTIIDEDNYQFLWDFMGDNTFVETQFNPTYEYIFEGVYNTQLQIVDKTWGCKDIISKPIQVFPYINCHIKFPNAFTPNLQNNNLFYPVYSKGILDNDYELSVFNRWGEMVWTTNNRNATWDGNYKGEFVKQDVYVYQCHAVCEDLDPTTGKQREILIKGDITVLR